MTKVVPHPDMENTKDVAAPPSDIIVVGLTVAKSVVTAFNPEVVLSLKVVNDSVRYVREVCKMLLGWLVSLDGGRVTASPIIVVRSALFCQSVITSIGLLGPIRLLPWCPILLTSVTDRAAPGSKMCC